MALICLLTAYKEDFYDPPDYTTLNYLLKNSNDRDLQKQCRSLLNRFLNEGENIFKIDSINLGLSEVDSNNNNSSRNEFGYETHIDIHDLSYGIIAEQLTIIDAVRD